MCICVEWVLNIRLDMNRLCPSNEGWEGVGLHGKLGHSCCFPVKWRKKTSTHIPCVLNLVVIQNFLFSKKKRLELFQSFLFQVRRQYDTRKQEKHTNVPAIVNKGSTCVIVVDFYFYERYFIKEEKRNQVSYCITHSHTVHSEWKVVENFFCTAAAAAAATTFPLVLFIAFIWFSRKFDMWQSFYFSNVPKSLLNNSSNARTRVSDNLASKHTSTFIECMHRNNNEPNKGFRIENLFSMGNVILTYSIAFEILVKLFRLGIK